MNAKSGIALPGIKGQRVAITAAAGGIGLTIAGLLYRLGAKVAICDVNEAALTKASEELGDCPANVTDVSDESDYRRARLDCRHARRSTRHAIAQRR